MNQFSDQQSHFLKGGSQNGGAIMCDTCNMTFNQTIFDDFQALIGGSITLLGQSNLNAYQISILDSYSFNSGGAIAVFVQNQISATIDNQIQLISSNTLQNISSGDLGGFIYLSNQFVKFVITNTQINQIGATNKGGFIYVDQASIVELDSIQLKQTNATQGSIVYSLSQGVTIQITDSTFDCFLQIDLQVVQQSLNVYNSSVFARVQKQPSILNQQSVFYISNAYLVTSTSNIYENCYVSTEGGIYTLIQTTFQDYSSTYQNNAAINGGSINCNGCNMTVIGSTFQNNYAYVGGAIYLQKQAYLNGQTLFIKKNTAFKEGGAIYSAQLSYFDLKFTQMLQNQAYESSAIKIFGGSEYFNSTLDTCLFAQNVANSSYTVSVDSGYIYIVKTNFRENSASKRTKNIFIIFSRMVLLSCKFWYDNHKYPISSSSLNNFTGGFILVGTNSFMYIQDSSFQNGEAYQGGVIYVSSESYLTVVQSSFTNNYAKYQGGAIYAQASLDISISQFSTFQDNQAIVLGDHIYMIDAFVNKLNIQDTMFSTSLSYSSAIYLDNVNQVNFTRIQATNIYANLSSTRLVQQYGGLLNCQKCDQLTILNSNFTNVSSAEYGGAIYVQMLDENKLSQGKFPNYPSVLIIGTYFKDCKAYIGAALYNENVDYILIQNSTFDKGFAIYNENSSDSGTAGGIFFDCEIDTSKQQCKMILKDQNYFQNNLAELQGGALTWNVIEIQFNSTSTHFINNTAFIYGNDLSSVPQQITTISLDYYTDIQGVVQNALVQITENSQSNFRLLQSNDTQQNTSLELQNYRSGGTIPTTYFAIVDKYGQVVTSNNASTLTISINSNYQNDSAKTKYSPILEGMTQFSAINGAYMLQNTQFTGSPGQKYTLELTTDAIDYRVPSNQQYLQMLNSEGKSQISFEMVMDLRFCEPGESFTSAGKCQYCDTGITFSLVEMTEPGNCQACPTDVAICLGGNQIGPQPGYWRASNVTDIFVECFNKDACLGMLPPDYNPTGQCAEGYQGLLCTDCQAGFSRSTFMGTTYKCSICPSQFLNALKLAGYFILYVIVLIFMVRSTLNGAKEEKNVTSIFLKILVNHLQLISLTQSFNFDFPTELQNFFSSSDNVKETTSTQILSVDCFMDTRKSNDDKLSPQLYFQKLIIIALIPILIVVIVVVIWSILKSYFERKKRAELGQEWKQKIAQFEKQLESKDQQEQEVATIQLGKLMKLGKYEIVGKMMSTIVILLFFMHPTIVEYTVSDFSCYEIQSENRVKVDLTILCYVGNHYFFSFAVALPCLIIWGIGIPLFALILLSRNRHSLNEVETKQKLGFLYNGYKSEFYFWEILIMYRKIIIILIANLLAQQGVMVQALIVLFTLLLFLGLNMKFRPFIIGSLNDLETLSILTQIITIYCGIYYVVDVTSILQSSTTLSTATIDKILKAGLMLSSISKYTLFLIIILANLAFFILWGSKILVEIKNLLIKKFPKIYIFFFMCNSKQRFYEMQSRIRAEETNELLKQEYERSMLFKSLIFLIVLKKLKELNDSGRLVLTQNILEKLAFYLHQDKVLDAINYQRGNILDDKGKYLQTFLMNLGILRALRERDNKIMMNQILQEEAKEHGIEDDGYYKNRTHDNMLQLDQKFMKGQLLSDDQLSINSSSSRITTLFNEATEKTLLSERDLKSVHNQSSYINDSSNKLFNDNHTRAANESGTQNYNFMDKFQSDSISHISTPLQQKRPRSNQVQIQPAFGRNFDEYKDKLEGDDQYRPKWERDYMRKRKGNLKDEEIYHELWGKEVQGDKEEQIQKLAKMKNFQDQRRLMNNFVIPTENDLKQITGQEPQNEPFAETNQRPSNVTFNKLSLDQIFKQRQSIIIQAKKKNPQQTPGAINKKFQGQEEIDQQFIKIKKQKKKEKTKSIQNNQQQKVKIHKNMDNLGKINEDDILEDLERDPFQEQEEDSIIYESSEISKNQSQDFYKDEDIIRDEQLQQNTHY